MDLDWSALPDPLLEHVFSMLQPEDLWRWAVCRSWRSVADSPTLWRHYVLARWPALQKALVGGGPSFRDFFVRRTMCLRHQHVSAPLREAKPLPRPFSDLSSGKLALHIEVTDFHRRESLYSALIRLNDQQRIADLFGVDDGTCGAAAEDYVSDRLGLFLLQDLCSLYSMILHLDVAVIDLESRQVAGLLSHRLRIEHCNHYAQCYPGEVQDVDVFLYSMPLRGAGSCGVLSLDQTGWGQVELYTSVRVAVGVRQDGFAPPPVKGVGISLLVGMALPEDQGPRSDHGSAMDDDEEDDGQGVLAFGDVHEVMSFLLSGARQLPWL